MPGVRHVVPVGETAVAVVAASWWQARTALEALPVVWEEIRGSRRIHRCTCEDLPGRPGCHGCGDRPPRRRRRCCAGLRRPCADGRASGAVPGACDDGAADMYRACNGRSRRSLGAYTKWRGHGTGRRANARHRCFEGRRQQVPRGWRVRPPRARPGLGAASRLDRQGGRSAGEDVVDPRRGYVARLLPADDGCPADRGLRQRGPAGRMEDAIVRLFDLRDVGAASAAQRPGHRHDAWLSRR